MTPSSEPARRLAAVWFADIVGYTSLSAQDEDGAMKVVDAFQRHAQEIVPQYSGRVVKYVGDAALCEFASTDGAIRAALAFVERFIQDPAAKSRGMSIRIGVNVGEVISAPDGDIYGDGVNLASRLQNQAEPGQVVASEAVHAQIRQRPVFKTEALGEKALKGIASPIRVYSVSLLEPGAEGAVTVAPAAAAQPATAAKSSAAAAAQRAKSGGLPRWALIGGGAAVLALGGVLLLGAGDVAVARATYPVVEGGLEVGAPITVEFTGALAQASATSQNVRLLDAQGQPVQAEVSLGADERSVVLKPRTPLVYAAKYTLVVSDALKSSRGKAVKGIDGKDAGASLPIQTQGVPSDATHPRLEAAAGFDASDAPASGPIRIHFTEAVEAGSAGTGVALTAPGGARVAAKVELADGNRELQLTPQSPLALGGRYVVRVDTTLRAATGLAATRDSVVLRIGAGRAAQAARTATTAPTTASPALTAPPAGMGMLNVAIVPANAQPYLKLVIDGDTAATLKGIALNGRPHTVVIVGVPDLSSFALPVFRQTVTVEPGKTLNLSAQITAFGSIDVTSDPAGAVYIDGRQVGRTPLAGYPVTASAIHRLEIRPASGDQGHGPFTVEFRVQPLEWKSLGRVTLPAGQR